MSDPGYDAYIAGQEAAYEADMAYAESEAARAEYEAQMALQMQYEADLAAQADVEAAREEFEASGEQEVMTEDF